MLSRKMKLAAVALFVAASAAGMAAESNAQDASNYNQTLGTSVTENCYTTFYQTKDMGCINRLVIGLPKLGGADDNSGGGINPGILGFFAEIFSGYPEEKKHLLAEDVPSGTKMIFTEALYVANLQDEAQTYASANGSPQAVKNMQAGGIVPLKQIKPVANPADNDLLIGAYMASGDKEYINRILENYSGADDAMVRDSLRLSMMMGKFGSTLAPPGRETMMMQNACQKYECKKDMHNLMRVMTLSSAFWAVGSLSQKDEVIKKTFTDFFGGDSRLKQLLSLESNAFSNYMTSLAAYSAVKDNANINNSLSAYEKFGADQGPNDQNGQGKLK